MRRLSTDIIQVFKALENESSVVAAGWAGDSAVSGGASRQGMAEDGIKQANNLGLQGDSWVAQAKNQMAVDDATVQNLKRAVSVVPAGTGLGLNRP
jgi:hypothetical protein